MKDVRKKNCCHTEAGSRNIQNKIRYDGTKGKNEGKKIGLD